MTGSQVSSGDNDKIRHCSGDGRGVEDELAVVKVVIVGGKISKKVTDSEQLWYC